MIRVLTLLLVAFMSLLGGRLFAQGCCSGGGNNPLSGTGPTGVLAKGQVELNFNNIYSSANKFYSGTEETEPYFDKVTSNYSLMRVEYGINENITLSTNLGYYGHRTIYEHYESDGAEQEKVTASGFGDLMIMPRFKVLSKEFMGRSTELNIGLGVKIPLSQPNDSTYVGQAYFINNNNGSPFLDSNDIWQLSPPMVQASTGSNDLMASFFFLHSLSRKYTLMASGMFINRGWNFIGIKYGNYASLGLFLGRSIGKSFNASLQVRAEWVGGIRTIKGTDYMSKYNIDKNSTGSVAMSLSPLFSYNYKSFRLFTILDFPVYQDLKGTQVALPKQINVGAAYNFYPSKKHRPSEQTIDFVLLNDSDGRTDLVDTTITVYGNCDMCKERIEAAALQLAGVQSANYYYDSQTLNLVYKSIGLDEIKQALAEVGHDTDTHKAKKSIYNNLHGCCKYERP